MSGELLEVYHKPLQNQLDEMLQVTAYKSGSDRKKNCKEVAKACVT